MPIGCLLDVQSLWQEKNANIPLLVDTATNSIINPVMNAANKRVINLVQNQKVKVRRRNLSIPALKQFYYL